MFCGKQRRLVATPSVRGETSADTKQILSVSETFNLLEQTEKEERECLPCGGSIDGGESESLGVAWKVVGPRGVDYLAMAEGDEDSCETGESWKDGGDSQAPT
jgi:hypothetical protein